jgi:hypothetical protein
MSSPAKLTDTQLVLLSAASQREDRCLIAAKNLKGGAAQKVAAKLLAAGLVREIKAKPGMAIWRRDEEAGQAYSLKLTAAGLKAIAVDEGDSQPTASTSASPNANEDSSKAKKAANMAATTSATAAPTSQARRQGTKIARVIALLQRDQGAKLDELIARPVGRRIPRERRRPAFAIAATTSAWSAARKGAPRSTAPSRPSRRPRDRHGSERDNLGSAAEGQFVRRPA